jgi:hypothetical protein
MGQGLQAAGVGATLGGRTNASEFLSRLGGSIMIIFVAIFFCKPHGMMEYWNTGYGKRKIAPSTKMLSLLFFNDAY